MLSEKVQAELDRARKLGEQLEQIVISKQYTDGERDTLLLAYWELVSDFHRGIHLLIQNELFGSAFALVRPVVESLVRAHIAIMGSDKDVERLRDDTYKLNFAEIGPKIDAAFDLDHFMENFLNDKTRNALHSYTHAGLQQLGRRFRDGQVRSNYSDEELIEVIRSSTSALFMLSNLVTKHFHFEEDWKKVTDMYIEWSQKSDVEGTTSRLPVPWSWRAAFFIPLTVDIVLQFVSHRETDLHTRVRISIIGNIFLFVPLISLASYWVRQSTEWWRIAMLIATSAGLGYGLAVLLRAL